LCPEEEEQEEEEVEEDEKGEELFVKAVNVDRNREKNFLARVSMLLGRGRRSFWQRSECRYFQFASRSFEFASNWTCPLFSKLPFKMGRGLIKAHRAHNCT